MAIKSPRGNFPGDTEIIKVCIIRVPQPVTDFWKEFSERSAFLVQT